MKFEYDVAIIDREEAISLSIAESLKEQKFSAIAITNRQSASLFLSNKPASVIIFDGTPYESTIDFALKLYDNCRNSIRIFALEENATSIEELDTQKYHVDMIIRKPYSVIQIINIINQGGFCKMNDDTSKNAYNPQIGMDNPQANPYGQPMGMNNQNPYGQQMPMDNGMNPYGQPMNPYGQQPPMDNGFMPQNNMSNPYNMQQNDYPQQPFAPNTFGQQMPNRDYGQPMPLDNSQPINPYGQPMGGTNQNPYGQPMPMDNPQANPYAQPINPYGQPMPMDNGMSPYGQPMNPYGQQPPLDNGMSPYGQPINPYGQPMNLYGQPMEQPNQAPYNLANASTIQRTGALKQTVIAVNCPKGGVGKTTISKELAITYATTRVNGNLLKVCLVDGNIGFGDVTTMLKVQSRPNIKTWANDIQAKLEANPDITPRYNQKTIEEEYLIKHQSGLYILAAPSNHADSLSIDANQMGTVIENLRNCDFDVIIIDTANNTQDYTLIALEKAQEILMVTTMEVTAISDTRALLNTLREIQFPVEKIKLVVNKMPPKQDKDINLDEIAEALATKIIGIIPDYPSIRKINNNGEPAMLGKENELTTAIRDLANKVVPIFGSFQESKNIPNGNKGQKVEKKSLFGGLFKKK